MARRGVGDRLLAAEALAWLLLASLALRLLPFARIASLAARGQGRAVPFDPGRAARIGRAVEAAARRVPGPPRCFARGLAAQAMLVARGARPSLCYGARPDAAVGVSAHVWVRLDGRDVIGGEEAVGLALLARFPAENSTEA